MRVLTQTRARIMLTVLKICCAGEASTAFLFRESILSSRSEALTLRVRVAITDSLVRSGLVG